jgi:hypothetical protein
MDTYKIGDVVRVLPNCAPVGNVVGLIDSSIDHVRSTIASVRPLIWRTDDRHYRPNPKINDGCVLLFRDKLEVMQPDDWTDEICAAVALYQMGLLDPSNIEGEK